MLERDRRTGAHLIFFFGDFLILVSKVYATDDNAIRADQVHPVSVLVLDLIWNTLSRPCADRIIFR